jgi:hypothetical protein
MGSFALLVVESRYDLIILGDHRAFLMYVLWLFDFCRLVGRGK